MENNAWPPSGKFKKFSKAFLKYESYAYYFTEPIINYDEFSDVVEDAVLGVSILLIINWLSIIIII